MVPHVGFVWCLLSHSITGVLLVLGRGTEEEWCPSHHIRSRGHVTCYHRDLSQGVSTFIPWLRRCLPGFSPGLSPSCFSLFLGSRSLSAAHTELPGGGNIYISYLGFFYVANLSLLPHLFSRLFLSVWIHAYIFYTWSCNPTWNYFVCSNSSSFGHWELFQVDSGVPFT